MATDGNSEICISISNADDDIDRSGRLQESIATRLQTIDTSDLLVGQLDKEEVDDQEGTGIKKTLGIALSGALAGALAGAVGFKEYIKRNPAEASKLLASGVKKGIYSMKCSYIGYHQITAVGVTAYDDSLTIVNFTPGLSP